MKEDVEEIKALWGWTGAKTQQSQFHFVWLWKCLIYSKESELLAVQRIHRHAMYACAALCASPCTLPWGHCYLYPSISAHPTPLLLKNVKSKDPRGDLRAHRGQTAASGKPISIWGTQQDRCFRAQLVAAQVHVCIETHTYTHLGSWILASSTVKVMFSSLVLWPHWCLVGLELFEHNGSSTKVNVLDSSGKMQRISCNLLLLLLLFTPYTE